MTPITWQRCLVHTATTPSKPLYTVMAEQLNCVQMHAKNCLCMESPVPVLFLDKALSGVTKACAFPVDLMSFLTLTKLQ